MQYANEYCWVLVGNRAGRAWLARKRRWVRGNAASVAADWRWALTREETRGDVVGFLHTHPLGFGTAPSDRDIRTMQAWCTAFGKPLFCLIADGNQLSAWLFVAEENEGRAVTARQIKMGKYWIQG